jgi:hypothetical protein
VAAGELEVELPGRSRGQGLFTELAERLVEEGRVAGVDLVGPRGPLADAAAAALA